MMEFRVRYFNWARQEAEATFGAIVEILLKSRLRVRSEIHQGFYDEDVNTYLAGVLFDYMDPQYQESVRRYLADRDTDVFLCATHEESCYRAYWVYKVNADDRLMDLGIFHPQKEGQGAVLGQMKTYYEFAAGYDERRHGHATAVSEIMEKLARRTDRYLSILHQVRREYLHFVEALTDEDLREFRQRLECDERALPLKTKQDEFLDSYLAWQQTSDPKAKARLVQLAEELQKLDPAFRVPGPLNPYI